MTLPLNFYQVPKHASFTCDRKALKDILLETEGSWHADTSGTSRASTSALVCIASR